MSDQTLSPEKVAQFNQALADSDSYRLEVPLDSLGLSGVASEIHARALEENMFNEDTQWISYVALNTKYNADEEAIIVFGIRVFDNSVDELKDYLPTNWKSTTDRQPIN